MRIAPAPEPGQSRAKKVEDMPLRAVTVSIAISFILLAVLSGLERTGLALP